MSMNISEKNRQVTQISHQFNSSMDKGDLSSPTLNNTRNDTILHSSGDTLQRSSSKWVEVNHIGTQTSPQDVKHRRNVVRPCNHVSVSTPLLERKRTEKERVCMKTSETEDKGLPPQAGQRGKKIRIDIKSNSQPLRTERKRKAAKRLKESDTSANRTITKSSRTIQCQLIGPRSTNRVRKKRARRSSKRSTSTKHQNRTTHHSRESSSRRKSIKTLYRSKFSNACQSETTFLDASNLPEICRSLLPEVTSSASNCAALPERKTRTKSVEGSGEITTLRDNEKTSSEISLEIRAEDPPTSPSGAGDFDVQMSPGSPYQSSLDYNTDPDISTTTDSTNWSTRSHEDISPKSSLLSFSGEVLRMRYSNPRLVLHALNPSGDRPKWPFNDDKKAMEVTCKAHEDMVFLFDSQYCDNALACWDKSYKAKHRNTQRKKGGSSAPDTANASSSLRNTMQPSKQSARHYSKPLNSETGISITDFASSLTAMNSFSPSERQSITYCRFQDFVTDRAGYTFGDSTTTYSPRWTSVKDGSFGSWTSRMQSVESYDKLCVGHNTCLDLTQGLPTAAGDGKLSSRQRNGKDMQTDKNNGFLLQGDSVWKYSSPPRNVDPVKKYRGRDSAGKKFNTTIRTTGGREIFVRTNKDVSQGSTVTESKGGANVPASTTHTSRGNNGFTENRMEMSCGAESGIWEIGGDVAQFACNTIVISKPSTESDQFLSKTEPLLLGHFRSGVSKRNVIKAEKTVCSAGASLAECAEPTEKDDDTSLGTPSYGTSISK